MPHTIHEISFNAAQDLFAVAGDFGIRVFNSHPITEMITLKSDVVGSVRSVALLERSNLIFMVSGEPCPKFSSKAVMVWDNIKQKFVAELTVASPIIHVLVSNAKIAIVQQSHIHVFGLDGFYLVCHEESGFNPQGICALSPSAKHEFLVYPSYKPGTIQVVNLRNINQHQSTSPATINAHESEIVKLTMDNQASKIATGSIKGTLIRVFNAHTKKMLYELRRGQHFAQLYSLRFSPDATFLSCCSDQGTLHIFDIEQTKGEEQVRTAKKLVDHFTLTSRLQKSLKQYSMPCLEQVVECAFITKNESNTNLDMFAVTKDGHYYLFSELSQKPLGYELIFNLAFDQEFWKM